MKIQWNKVTWYSKVAAVVLGLVIFALGIYIGIIYQRGLDALDWAEQLRIDRAPVVEKTVEDVKKNYEFSEEGNLRNIPPPGSTEDWWVLVYERPGAPALTTRLIFTTESRCVIGGQVGLCDVANVKQGQRVRAMGHMDAKNEIVVERLEMVE